MAKVNYHQVGDITPKGIFVGYFSASQVRNQEDKKEIDRMREIFPQYKYIDCEFVDKDYKLVKKFKTAQDLERVVYNAVYITKDF